MLLLSEGFLGMLRPAKSIIFDKSEAERFEDP